MTNTTESFGIPSEPMRGAVTNLIDGMSDEEFNRDRSNENPNVGERPGAVNKTSDERLADIIEILAAVVKAGDCRLRSADDRVHLPFKADTLLLALTELQQHRKAGDALVLAVNNVGLDDFQKRALMSSLEKSAAYATPAPEPQPEVAAEPVAWASCPSCNGTGDQGGNPSYGECEDCGGLGKIGDIAAHLVADAVYDVVGTTADGVDILAPAVPSKNFTPDQIREAIAKSRENSFDNMPPSSLPPKPLADRLEAAAISLHAGAREIGCEYSSVGSMIDEAAAALRALASPPVVEEAVKAEPRVRDLEWGVRRIIDGVNWAWDAKTSIDWYVVATASGEGCKGAYFWFVSGSTIKGWANSEAEAKAAAQADFTARILSALSSGDAS